MPLLPAWLRRFRGSHDTKAEECSNDEADRPQQEDLSVRPIEEIRTSPIYWPLDEPKRQIRLLRMQHDHDEGIHLELKTFSLDDNPAFRALSYLWTQAAADHTVYIDGHAFLVRPNLYHYLDIMREEEHTDWIFIDAICINQEDLAERSSQVALMGDVYRSAELVVVWLGNLPDETAIYFQFLDDQRPLDTSWVGSWDEQSLRNNGAVLFGIIGQFVWLEYWDRIWIIQEVLLARGLLFRRGCLQATLEMLCKILRLYLIPEGPVEPLQEFPVNQRLVLLETLNPSKDPDYYRQHLVIHLLHQIYSGPLDPGERRNRSISKVLTAYPGQKCSVQYDGIYALLGLTNSLCKVDYQEPKIILYLRVLFEAALHDFGDNSSDGSPDNENGRYVGILLMKALGLRPSHPVVFYTTTRARALCSKVEFSRFAKIQYPTDLAYGCYAFLSRHRPSLAFTLGGIKGAHLRRQVAYWRRKPDSRLPACDSLGKMTLSEWDSVIEGIFEEVKGQLQRQSKQRALETDGKKCVEMQTGIEANAEDHEVSLTT